MVVKKAQFSPNTLAKARRRGIQVGRTMGRADRPAVLGDGIRVHVAEDSNYYYFRFVEGEDENGTRYSAPGVALATGAPIIPQNGYPITISYVGNTPIVKEASPQRLIQRNINPKVTNWLMPDNKFIDLNFAVLGYSVRVDTTTTQNMEIMVKPFYYLDDTNNYQVVGDVKLDLTSYIPTADGEGNARHLLAGVFVDKDNSFSIVTSTAKVTEETLTHTTDVVELFNNAPIRATGLRAYRLYTGQTGLTDIDSFCDLRMWLRTPLRKNNYTAITNPTVNDDIDDGYEVNSLWFNTITDEWWKCYDETSGAADWREEVNVKHSIVKGDAAIPVWDADDSIWYPSDIFALSKENTGFPDRLLSVIDNDSIDLDLHKFTLQLAPAQSEYIWFRWGKRLANDDDDSIVFDELEGTHYIYYNEAGVLTDSYNPGLAAQLVLFSQEAMVTIIYWDNDNRDVIYLADERHGFMPGVTHSWLHNRIGTIYQSGLGLGNFSLDDATPDDASSQSGVENGVIVDEDITFAINDGLPQELSPILYVPVFYKEGANGYWRREWVTSTWQATTVYSLGDRILADNSYWEVTTPGTSGGVEPTWSGSPYPGNTIGDGTVTWTNVGTPRCAGKNYVGGNYRLAWNEFTGGVWTQTEVNNNQFTLFHIFATNDVRHPIIAVQGQTTYLTATAARAAAETAISELITDGLPFVEFVPIATGIFQTNTIYNNESRAKIVSIDGSSQGYVDFRTAGLTPGTIPGTHNLLSGLGWVGSGHTGAINSFAGFDSSGNAITYLENLYALLGGRAGGQTQYGGTGASENYNIGSTSNATKGKINLFDNVDQQATIQFSGDISPAQITSDQNDYSPTGLSTASTLRLSSDASRNITGLSGGVDGRILTIHNVGSNDIVLIDESASSTATNRFALNDDIIVLADNVVLLQYDSTSGRWRALNSNTNNGEINFKQSFLFMGG